MKIEEALEDFAQGKFVIITDDEDRENEGDLMLLAEKATAQSVGFMVRHTSGVICVALTQEIATTLKLPAMVKKNEDDRHTAYTVSVDVAKGLTTGISAKERANTINHLANPQAIPGEFVRPGHVFPLVAHPKLFAARQGHTEAGVAMAKLVGAYPATAISEIVLDDGSLARGAALQKFADENDIPIFTMQELVQYSQTHLEVSVSELQPYAWAKLPRKNSEWEIAVHIAPGGAEHAILRFGNPEDNPLIRLHSECLTGDALGSLRCDCGDQLEAAFHEIENQGAGYVIYLRDHEGRGIGLHQKIAAYILQDSGLDTVDANLALGHEIDEREWSSAQEILKRLNITQLTLLTNNPQKKLALTQAGIQVTTKPLEAGINEKNREYLTTKKNRMAHQLNIN